MRKIYLLALVLFAVNTLSAKTTLTLKPNSFRHGKSTTERNGNPSNTTNALTGSILCNTQYVAGTSMTLNFTLTFTNTDFEYCDQLTITFPTGITPTGTANTPNFAPITDIATGQTPEAYNGVTGQSISWGDNDNAYGGIESLGNTGGITYYNFTVDVTVGAGVTGTQVATFLASGDGYGTTPADLNGTISMFQSGSSIDDASCSIGGVQATTNCNNTTLPIAVRIKNLGTTTISNFPVSYAINANPAVTETVTDVLVPGDSVDYFFTALGDFTAEGAYTIAIYTGLAGDAIHANDTINDTFTNAVSTQLSTTPYANDFETNADFIALITQANAGSVTSWGLSQTTFQSGAQALFMTAAAGVGDAWIFLKCMDVVGGDTYRVTYWKRTNTGYNGSTGVSYGDSQDATAMVNVIKPITANNANATWEIDSADFTPSTTGTINIGFRGQGTAAGSGTNCRLDNINIFKVVPVGIASTNVADNVSIYPNPTNGILNINLTSNEGFVTVYNLLGKEVIATKAIANGHNTINVENLSEGTYFVKLVVNGSVITRKVTISK